VRGAIARAGLRASLALTALVGCGGGAPQPQGPAARSDAGGATSLDAGVQASSESDLAAQARDAYAKGFAAWGSGDLPEARAAFEKALVLAPKMGRAEYGLGRVLEQLGDADGAQFAYRAAIVADPADENAMSALALLLAQTGASSQAEAFLQEMRAKLPQSVRLSVVLAEVKSMGGDSTAAQQMLQETLQKNPVNVDALIGVARDHYRAKKPELAMRALTAILGGESRVPPRDTDNPEGLVLRGLLERARGLRAQAVDDFRHALLMRPDLFEAYMNLGEIELTTGNAFEAQPSLEKAVRYAPNSALAHLYLGDCYRVIGRAADAKTELDAALKIDPKLASAHYELGLFYLSWLSDPWGSDTQDRIAKAVAEFEIYKSTRGPDVSHGRDDVDERLAYARSKQRALQASHAAVLQTPDAHAANERGIRALCARNAEDGIKKCQLLAPDDPSDCAQMCLDEYREAHAPAPVMPQVASRPRAPSSPPPPPSPPDPYFVVLGECIRRVREGDTRPACSFSRPLDQMGFGQAHCNARCAELTEGFRAAR
jgi:tetratricopeptide (TPR) repeat protein